MKLIVSPANPFFHVDTVHKTSLSPRATNYRRNTSDDYKHLCEMIYRKLISLSDSMQQPQLRIEKERKTRIPVFLKYILSFMAAGTLPPRMPENKSLEEF